MKVKLTERDIREAVRRSLSMQVMIRESSDEPSRFGGAAEKISKLASALVEAEDVDEVYIEKSDGTKISFEKLDSGDFLQMSHPIWKSEEGVPYSSVIATRSDTQYPVTNLKLLATLGNYISLMDLEKKVKDTTSGFVDLEAGRDAQQTLVKDFDPKLSNDQKFEVLRMANEQFKKSIKMRVKKIRVELSNRKITKISAIFDPITVAGYLAAAQQKDKPYSNKPGTRGFTDTDVQRALDAIVPPRASSPEVATADK
jgi:hypothetical protein